MAHVSRRTLMKGVGAAATLSIWHKSTPMPQMRAWCKAKSGKAVCINAHSAPTQTIGQLQLVRILLKAGQMPAFGVFFRVLRTR